MCRTKDAEKDRQALRLAQQRLSETGSMRSNGHTGELSRSDPAGATLARHQKGLSTISAGSLILIEECPGTFSALKRGALEGYTVTLSCDLTSSDYAGLLATLGNSPSGPGKSVSVAVKFEPMTANLVQHSTAQSI